MTRASDWRCGLAVSLLAFLVSCASPLIIDRSSDAFAAGDMTLAISACQSVPGPGMDSCQVTDGDNISTDLVLIAPKPGTAHGVNGGTVDLYYNDIHKSYPISDWTVQVPWASFFGMSQWSKASLGAESVVEALVTLNWTDNQGVQQVTKYRGIAMIIVTAKGYDRMPINSGNQAWSTTCTIQYSTAGRSAIKCQ